MPVRQEKNKKKWTSDGRSWYFKDYYTDQYGKRKQYQSRYYKDRDEAELKRAKWLLKNDTNDNYNINISFPEVYSEWLEWKKRQIKTTTYYTYKKCCNKNILNFFKEYKLHSIKLNIINQYYEFLESTELTINSKNRMIGCLKEILSYARDNYKFDNKIVSRIQKQKNEDVCTSQRDAEWNFWTNDEFNLFIKHVDNYLDNLIFYFMYYTGVRIGELVALTWNDIDLKQKTLTINKTFTNKLGNGSYKITTPKTKNSIRTIDLDDELIIKLKEYYEKESKIYAFNNNMFIFGNAKYIPPTTLARHLDNYIKKVNSIETIFLKRITLHGFRHSHASLLIYLGCDSRMVANRLGDTVEVIESTYIHLFPNKKSHSVNALNTFKAVKIRGE